MGGRKSSRGWKVIASATIRGRIPVLFLTGSLRRKAKWIREKKNKGHLNIGNIRGGRS